MTNAAQMRLDMNGSIEMVKMESQRLIGASQFNALMKQVNFLTDCELNKQE